jgi:hypothetical protein
MNQSVVARSAALGLALAALAAPAAGAQQEDHPPQDLRSPDARDAGEHRGDVSAPEVTVVKVPQASPANEGLDWGDAGIGAGGLLGLMLLGLGGALAVVHHRRRGHVRRQTAPTG